MTPVTLSIAGSDSCSGAGIQADLKTFSSLGCHGLTAVTAVVAETPHRIDSIFPLPPQEVRAQIQSLSSTYPIAAIKTGMLGTPETAQTIGESLQQDFTNTPHLVVDPVLTASEGSELSPAAILDIYREMIFPQASLITPNIPEAEAILQVSISDKTIAESAKALSKLFKVPCLLKGGHLSDKDQCIDYLSIGSDLHTFSHPRLHLIQSHGTGCTLSAAITAYLANGDKLYLAVEKAIEWAHKALGDSLEWSHNQRITQCINQAELTNATKPHTD